MARVASTRRSPPGNPPTAGRRVGIWPLAATLVLVGVTIRPLLDFSRGDLPVYLQTRSFAELRLDVPVPPGARQMPVDMAYKDGRYFSHYPPGGSLVMVPFYWIGHAIDLLTGQRFGRQTSEGWSVAWPPFLVTHAANLLFLAGVLLFLARLARIFGASREVTANAALLTVLAAPLWAEASHLWNHLSSTMFSLAAAVLVFEGRPAALGRLRAAGFAGAIAFLIRPPVVVLLALLALYIVVTFRRRLAALVSFGAPIVLGVAVMLWFNAAMFGGPLAFGYNFDVASWRGHDEPPRIDPDKNQFANPLGEGLLGLTIGAISPQPPSGGIVRHAGLPRPDLPWHEVRGLILLIPAIVFALPGLAGFWRDGRRAEVAVVGAHFVLFLLLYSKWSWWFGHGHLPIPSRFLTETYPPLCLAIAAYEARAVGFRRAVARFTIFWSIANQAIFVAAAYLHFFTGFDLIDLATVQMLAVLALTSALATVVAAWMRPGYSGGEAGESPTG